ncbi:hypothetical protein ACL2XP_09355 [Sodalis sp. RH21]|uniref:hypothetical protein n=1 Tax=unclassified Sodalis (in: enterobacteria) TaxID=2636512 RepID=UPI0039B43703
MDIYDRCYQQLKQTGQQAWTGEGYERAWRKLTATLQSLKDDQVLPATIPLDWRLMVSSKTKTIR